MIEYLSPSGGGGSLTYPIKQVTVDFTSADFTTLNTNPLVVLPAEPTKAYCLLSLILDWENINWSTFYVAFFEIGAIAGGNLGTINDTIFRTTGISTTVIPFNTTLPNVNVRKNRAFQLTASANNAGVSFSRFIVTVTYIEYTL